MIGKSKKAKVVIYQPKEINRAEALKKVRKAINTTRDVSDAVGGPTMDGTISDEWALGFLLQLQVIGLIRLT